MQPPYFAQTLWSSSLPRNELGRVQKFLEGNGFNGIDVALASPEGSGAERVRWANFYNIEGACFSEGQATPIPVGAMFLKLTFAYKSKEARDAKRSQRIHIGSVLRLMFGAPIARELVQECYIDTEESKQYSLSDTGFASYFDTQKLNLFIDPSIEDSRLRFIPLEASTLLESAFAQRYPRERFILMWLAFEAITNCLPGKGSNGQKRQRYFEDELSSQLASDEVTRIFQVRNDSFKEGKFEKVQFDQISCSLYAAFQLTVLEDCPQRDSFLSGYERYIQTKE